MATNGTATLDFTKFYNVIDGQLVETPQTRCSVNPSTLEDNAPVPVSTQEHVEKAIAAARAASEGWEDVSFDERRKAMLSFADAIEANSEGFCRMLTLEQGKPVSIR